MPKCATGIFKEMNENLNRNIKLGMSKGEFFSSLDIEDILNLKGICECSFSFITQSKLAEWRRMRHLFDITHK